MQIRYREIIHIILAWGCFASVNANSGAAVTTADEFVSRIRNAPFRVETVDKKVLDPSKVRLNLEWTGNCCSGSVKNTGTEPVRIENIIIADLTPHGVATNIPIYGEGFQMLTQTRGTLSAPYVIRAPFFTDGGFYKTPEPDHMRTCYGLFTLDFGFCGHAMIGFTSCRKYIGRISFNSSNLRVSVDPEGLTLDPGETWTLEEFMVVAGMDRNALLDQLAAAIQKNHPTLRAKDLPTGWCTWYSVGGAGNQGSIIHNLSIFATNLPTLRYIQIDEGYSPREGDWLEPNAKFGDMSKVLQAVNDKGFLPGMWLAPFIAEKDSNVLKDHPDWFVKGTNGLPLDSGTLGFGGWHNGPWRCLDGTHPEVQKHFETIFRTMREKWGVTYFKLDANYWGAIHSGKRYDAKATRVEAYRRGMEAIVKGAGPGATILGCNAPMWPSFGLVTSMRVSNDIDRHGKTYFLAAKENFCRGWQSGKLWYNDPDCVMITVGTNRVPRSSLLFHATVVHAVGGLVVSGDAADNLRDWELVVMRKLMPSTGQHATFENLDFEVGMTDLGNRQFHYCFNWNEHAESRVIKLKGKVQLVDYWTDENLGVHEGVYSIEKLAGKSARLILAQPAK